MVKDRILIVLLIIAIALSLVCLIITLSLNTEKISELFKARPMIKPASQNSGGANVGVIIESPVAPVTSTLGGTNAS